MFFTIDLHCMNFVFPTYVYIMKIVTTYISYTNKKFVFLKYSWHVFLKILTLLSLSAKLHHWKKKFGLLTIVTNVWPKLLIETKKSENYYKFVNLNAMAFKTS
jgi:hypothetical protein